MPQSASPTTPTHAGAVVFRETAEGREYLIVESSGGGEWVLPKGHVEKSESMENAALREIQEEAAFTAEIVAPLGTVTYAKGDEWVRVIYFLARAGKPLAATEKRVRQWLPYAVARDLLTFDVARELLSRAERVQGFST